MANEGSRWDDDQLERLTRANDDSDRQVLLRGATILSMDDAVGDFAVGDVLIRGKTIEAVGTTSPMRPAMDSVRSST